MLLLKPHVFAAKEGNIKWTAAAGEVQLDSRRILCHNLAIHLNQTLEGL